MWLNTSGALRCWICSWICRRAPQPLALQTIRAALFGKVLGLPRSFPPVKFFRNFLHARICASLPAGASLCLEHASPPFRPKQGPQNLCYARPVHTQETQQEFIERRAQGWSLVRLAAELDVAKSTLIEWSRKFRFDIQNRRALELDELQGRVLGTVESRVLALSERLGRVEAELSQRDLADVPTAQLHSLAASLRRQIERETGAIRLVAPVKDIPSDEYVEQVQQWNP